MASNGDDLFGGMFDFDGNGKTDPDEEFLAYMMFEEAANEENDDNPDDLFDDGSDDDDDLFDDDDDLSDDDDELSDDDDEEDVIDDDAQTYASALQFDCGTAAEQSAAKSVSPFPTPDPQPEKITWEDYREQRRACVKEVWTSIWQMLLLSFVPGAVIYAAISTYDGKTAISALVTLVFTCGGLAAVGVVWFSYLRELAECRRKRKECKAACMESAPEPERQALNKKKRIRAVCTLLFLAAGVIGVITLCTAGSAKTVSIYEEAETLIAAGKYPEAAELLTIIKDRQYRDTEPLLCLCKAHMDYDRGHALDAYYDMLGVTFRYQTPAHTTKIESFRAVLQNEHDAYREQKAEQSAAPQETQKTTAPTAQPSATTKTRGSGSSKEWSFDYDVDDFLNPEDFYDWYRDDFVDFEEAEDYYDSHGGQ